MAVTPRISLTAFEDRAGQFIFVAIPDERGRYLRTDKSVAMVACPVCAAAIGEPCMAGRGTSDGYSSVTHALRRSEAQRQYRHFQRRNVDDVIRQEISAGLEFPPIEVQEGA